MRTLVLPALLLPALLLALTCPTSIPAQTAHTFKAEGSQFTLDGKPFRIISGEMHYARIPRAYWRDRLRKARAMGLNTVTTYVFWNVHEPRPGTFDFSGNYDVAEFIREAQQEGLYVILRPGPYACAEWEFGGFPAWLLKDRTAVVRSLDPKFMTPATRWLKRLGQELAPLQLANGGPIVLIQVENEYGSFSGNNPDDRAYMEATRQALLDAGFNKTQLYTADGPEPERIAAGSLPDLPVGINFGGEDPAAAEKAFALLNQSRPTGPRFNSEFWDGWFQHWGAPYTHTSTANQAANLDYMLSHGYSVSVYMFHGGTSFGWMNGANSANDKPTFEPDVSSYDYDSPLDESGRPTPKFTLFRDLITKATGITPPPVPATPAPITVPAFPLTESVPLWSTLPQPVSSPAPLSMEDLDQSYGYILYRTRLAAPVSGALVLDALHDYAQVYLNGVLAGTLDRRSTGSSPAQTSLSLDSTKPNTQLDILVENSGRINFSKYIRGERKGITTSVSLAGHPLTGWQIFTLPMEKPAALPFTAKPCTGPCFSRATFNIAKPGDTFLDTSALGKGQLWINGFNLGRFWKGGPQKTLYLPAPLLKSGANEIVVFDLNTTPSRTLGGLASPQLGK